MQCSVTITGLNMLWKLAIIIIFTFCLEYGSFTQSRRVSYSNQTISDKRFMVYLVQSEKSNTSYDHWLCSGVIVSPSHILTSAACLIDVPYIYVIAGYKKYVRTEHLNYDNCTRRHKNKVIKTCIPRKYKFNYNNVTEWFHLDIGLAIVEKPYNFSDLSYRDYCSHVPGPIKINYDPMYTATGTQALVYGWGHLYFHRPEGNYQDYNAKYMREGKTKITDKKKCKENYSKINSFLIDNYMICCWGSGILDSEGIPNEIKPINNNGVRRRIMDNRTDHVVYRNTTKNENFKNDTISLKTGPIMYSSRRQGLCQNDHGAPLVTWIGSHEYVLGLGSTYIVSSAHLCLGPYMYTSTQCASRFIKCALNEKSLTRKMCDNMGIEEGYEIHETEIDWNILDGNVNDKTNVDIKLPNPAENEDGKDIFKLDLDDSQNDPINSFENNDGNGFLNLDLSYSNNHQNDAVNDFPNGDVKSNINENKKTKKKDKLFPSFVDTLDFNTDEVVVI